MIDLDVEVLSPKELALLARIRAMKDESLCVTVKKGEIKRVEAFTE